MLPDSKQKKATLTRVLTSVLPLGSFETSGPKQDGTMFVRCKSTDTHAAIHVSFRLIETFNRMGVEFMQTDDCKFRVPLDRFDHL